MKNKSSILIVCMFMLVFTLSFISAAQTVQISTSETKIVVDYPKSVIQKIDTPFSLSFRTFNYSDSKVLGNGCCNCSVSLKDNNGYIIYQSDTAYNTSTMFHNKIIPAEYFNQTGTYSFDLLCIDGSIDGFASGTYTVTPTGEPLTSSDLNNRIFIIIVFIILIFTIYNYTNRVDFDKSYKRLLKQYEDNNYVKFVTNSIWYNILQNSWVLYYLSGLVITTLLFDISYIFNITSIVSTLKVLLYMMSWGLIVVGLIFLSKIQEWIVYFIDELDGKAWGSKR